MPDPLNKMPYKQDLPPSGGYKGIQFRRVPTYTAKSGLLLAGVALLLPIGFWDYKTRRRENMRNLLEDDEGRISLEPLLTAEQDRVLLWQMRRNRDEENELMKNVPGWVTGTWFGEPVFKTNAHLDKWVEPNILDVFPHTSNRDMVKFARERHMHP